jgi:hypothetical protein
MSLWTATDNDAGKPKSANTSEKALMYGVNAAEVAAADGDVPHTGWVRVVQGTGQISAVVINDGGTGYANDEVVEFSAGGGVATVETDGSGVITGITITDYGTAVVAGVTATVNTAGGSGADLTVTQGGRAGRTQYEVMAAIGITSGDGTVDDDAVFPDA